jgi:hypothetical protein
LTAPPNVGFLSRGERKEDRAQAWKPGPGAYEAKSDFNKRAGPPAFSGSKKAVGREDKHVVWFRAPSAPSIPKQDQAFGYEEGPLGQLVKQKPPLLIHKGEREDRVGPGNYDPSIAITKPNARGSDFSRSKSARTSITRAVPQGAMLETNPGPGTYELNAATFEELPAFVKKVLFCPCILYVSCVGVGVSVGVVLSVSLWPRCVSLPLDSFFLLLPHRSPPLPHPPSPGVPLRLTSTPASSLFLHLPPNNKTPTPCMILLCPRLTRPPWSVRLLPRKKKKAHGDLRLARSAPAPAAGQRRRSWQKAGAGAWILLAAGLLRQREAVGARNAPVLRKH